VEALIEQLQDKAICLSGGAMLEHLEGKVLPGIAAVQG
jgi:3-phosphoglycerate kinase